MNPYATTQLRRNGPGGAVLLVLLSAIALGCQTTHVGEDGSVFSMSLGDVKIAACGESSGSVIRAAADNEGVVPPNPTTDCLVIHEGGLSAIAGETLSALFDAALAVIGRSLP